MEKHLTNLKPGLRAKIKQLILPKDIRDKLYELGLIPGQEIEILQDAPLGGPIKIKIGNEYCLAIRRREAAGIVVEELNGKSY